MNIRIRFSIGPKRWGAGGERWTAESAKKLVKRLAAEKGYLYGMVSNYLVVTFCPEGYLWMEWKRGRMRGDCQTDTVGPGFHAAVVDFLEELALKEKLHLRVYDRTGYYDKRDFLALRSQHFYPWFLEMVETASQWTEDSETLLGWPASFYLPEGEKGKLITHIRPFSYRELRGIVGSGMSIAFAKELFIWNEKEKDAWYYRNCGLVLLNQECYFMPSGRSARDKMLNNMILDSLEKALKMDPKIPFPQTEYLTLCRLADHEPVDMSGVEELPESGFIGCRKGIVYRKLGNVMFGIPGSFLFDDHVKKGMDHYYDGEEYGAHNYYIYAMVMEERGPAVFKDVWFKQTEVKEILDFDVEGEKGRMAIFKPVMRDGALIYALAGQVLYQTQRTNVLITWRKEEEEAYAVNMMKKFKLIK